MEKGVQQLNTNLPDVMDLGDLAELLRATRPFIREQIKKGKIPAVRFGRGKFLITRQMLLLTLDRESKAILESSSTVSDPVGEFKASENTNNANTGGAK